MTRLIDRKRIIHNYTAQDAIITAVEKAVVVPALSSFDLTLQYSLPNLAKSSSLESLLLQGITNFQIEDENATLYSQEDGINLIKTIFSDEANNTQTLEGQDSIYHRTITNHVGSPNSIYFVSQQGEAVSIPLGGEDTVLTSTGETSYPTFTNINDLIGKTARLVKYTFIRNGVGSSWTLLRYESHHVSEYTSTPIPQQASVVGVSYRSSNSDTVTIEILDGSNNTLYSFNKQSGSLEGNLWTETSLFTVPEGESLKVRAKKNGGSGKFLIVDILLRLD